MKEKVFSTSTKCNCDKAIESLKEPKEIIAEGQTTDLDTRYFRLKQKKINENIFL